MKEPSDLEGRPAVFVGQQDFGGVQAREFRGELVLAADLRHQEAARRQTRRPRLRAAVHQRQRSRIQ